MRNVIWREKRSSEPDRLIAVNVSEVDGRNAVLCTVTIHGSALVHEPVSAALRLEHLHDISQSFDYLLQESGKLKDLAGEFDSLGNRMFECCLSHSWREVSSEIEEVASRCLLIISNHSLVMNLPWELLQPPGSEWLALDSSWSIQRLPYAAEIRRLREGSPAPAPGPLRVLYLIAAPVDQADLDIEREEELLLQTFSLAGNELTFDSCDMGSFSQLVERARTYRPHIVHLTGHPIFRKDRTYFAFENERGESDVRAASELGQMLADCGVSCLFVACCHLDKSANRVSLFRFAQELLGEGVQYVVGSTAAIADEVAIQVASNFYREVAAGETVDRALAKARRISHDLSGPRGDPTWLLPVAYTGALGAGIFHSTHKVPSITPSQGMQALPGMVEGHTPNFIGRRRELQHLLPALISGELQALILTGIGGAGKSTLATRLAHSLQGEGWTPVALASTFETPINSALMLEICGGAFLSAGQREIYAALRDATVPVSDRLSLVVDGLNRGRFVLVIDNFDANLDEENHRILDPEMAIFYRSVLRNLVGGSRVIITTRHIPSDLPHLPRTVRQWQLHELGRAGFLKFLLRDPLTAERYRRGELPHELLLTLHRLLGGTPRSLSQIRAVLSGLSKDELTDALADLNRSMPSRDHGSVWSLAESQSDPRELLFTGRLYERLQPLAQRALSQVVVYGIPVTFDALAAVTDVAVKTLERFVVQWQELSLIQAEGSGTCPLWSVNGTLRHELLRSDRLTREDRRAAHRAAGAFLVDLVASDREGDLATNWVACLLEARSQFLAAKELDEARAVSAKISVFYVRNGLYTELERIQQELLRLEEHPETLSWLGRAYAERANYGPARAFYQRALLISEHVNREAEFNALDGLALIDLYEGVYEDARKKYHALLGLSREVGALSREASIWQQLAAVDVECGALSDAKEKYQRALEIRRSLGEHAAEAATLHQLATVQMNEGDYGAARDGYERALAIRQQVGDRAAEAATWHQIATIELLEGSFHSAREKFERSLAARQQIGDRAAEAATWHQLATLDFQERSYAAAREKFERSLVIRQHLGDRAGEAATWHQLAKIDIQQEAFAAAREKLNRSLEILQRTGNVAGEAATWHQLAMIDILESKLLDGREKFERAMAIHQQIGDRISEAAIWYHLGHIAANLGRTEEGLRLLGICYLIDKEIGHHDSADDLKAVLRLAQQLHYDDGKIQEQLKRAAGEYAKNKGAELLRDAFG